MWEYTDKVSDHFRNPRNVGEVENPDGNGLAGSLACGDALRLTFKLDGDALDTLYDLGHHTKHVDTIFNRVFTKA